MSLSRRHFLKLAGIALLAPTTKQFIPFEIAQPAYEFPAVMGRTLTAAPVYAMPDGAVHRRLFPDTVVSLLDSAGDWYRAAGGYVRRADVQPMQPRPTLIAPPAPPFWAEVGAAVAVVRAWCAADAPLVARVGHGGVLRVVDALTLNDDRWYALADAADAPLGWALASAWDALTPPLPLSLSNFVRAARGEEIAPLSLNLGRGSEGVRGITLDRAARTVTAYAGDRAVLRAPALVGDAVVAGEYPLTAQQISARHQAEHVEYHGTPWITVFGEIRLMGAYWHHRFGAVMPGYDVQVAPAAARWLYRWAGARFTVV